MRLNIVDEVGVPVQLQIDVDRVVKSLEMSKKPWYVIHSVLLYYASKGDAFYRKRKPVDASC